MRIAMIADTHLGQYWRTNPFRANRIFEYFIKNIQLISEHSDYLVIMGDFLHSSNLPPDCIRKIYETILPELYSKFKNVDIVVGNHEVFMDSDGIQKSYTQMIFDNRCKIYESGVEKMMNLSSTSSFFSIPFQQNLEIQFECVNKLIGQSKENVVIFGHFTPKEIFSKFDLSVKSLTSNDKIKKIFLGDYHDPTCVIDNDTEIYSIGSTYYWDISDVAKKSKKRFLILDTETLRVESHNLILPEIKTFEITSETDLQEIFTDKENIYYVVSNDAIDFTDYISKNYDIYFRYTASEKMKTTIEGVTLDTSNFVDLSTCWPDYLKLQHCDDNVKEIANYIFMNRNSITNDEILKMVGGN